MMASNNCTKFEATWNVSEIVSQLVSQVKRPFALSIPVLVEPLTYTTLKAALCDGGESSLKSTIWGGGGGGGGGGLRAF